MQSRRSGDQDNPLVPLHLRMRPFDRDLTEGIMASGHVNRANRPNTWLHRPTLQRDDSSCQPGAVHTWPLADIAPRSADVCFPGE